MCAAARNVWTKNSNSPMPHGETHEKQKKKNLAMLVALLTLMAVLYAITLIKFHP